jgi:hypothetical protein
VSKRHFIIIMEADDEGAKQNAGDEEAAKMIDLLFATKTQEEAVKLTKYLATLISKN